VYFLECRKDLLVEWLDLVGLEHEDGTLKDDSPVQPAEKKLLTAVERYLSASDDLDRDLLLRAFAAQQAVDWPALEARLAEPAREAAGG
jgi:hypothetical protein